MKKLFSLLLILIMLLTLCACGGQTSNNGTGTTGSTTDTTQTSPATETTQEITDKRPSRLPTENVYEELPADCEHGYANATCTKPKTCVICSFELGDPLGHDFASGICTRCGAAEGVEDEATAE